LYWIGEADFKLKAEFYLTFLKDAERILATNPNDQEGWSLKGVALVSLNNFMEGMKCFNIALEINPRYTDALYYKGNTYIKLLYFEDAIKCFNEILRINTYLTAARNNKGYCFAQLKQYEEALKCLEHETKNRIYAPFYYNRACIQSLKQEIQPSFESLKCAIELDKQHYYMAVSDPDLDLLRHQPQFDELKKLLS